MTRWIIVWLVMSLSPAVAQPNMLGFPGSTKTSYLGPGDIVSGATAWYGLRAYSAAVAATGTQKAINIRRTSDSTTSDILILTTGGLDLATANTFCVSTTCFVAKWYDQSGNARDAIQATAANQPQLLFNCIGVLPCVSALSSASVVLASSANFTPATGVVTFSLVSWVNRTSGVSVMLEENGTQNRVSAANAAATWQLTGGASGFVQAAASDSAWHAAVMVMNGSSSVINIAGTETTGSTVGSTAAGPIRAGLGLTTSLLEMSEAGFWDNVAFNANDRASLISNQDGWWNL